MSAAAIDIPLVAVVLAVFFLNAWLLVQNARQRRSDALVEPFIASPLVIGEKDASQLGQLLRQILERGEQERPLVEREREQLDLVVAGLPGKP